MYSIPICVCHHFSHRIVIPSLVASSRRTNARRIVAQPDTADSADTADKPVIGRGVIVHVKVADGGQPVGNAGEASYRWRQVHQ
jgi:hypothetical protein